MTRGDPEASRRFAAFYMKDGKVIAMDAVNRPQEFMFARKLIAAGGAVDKVKLADEETPLKELSQ